MNTTSSISKSLETARATSTWPKWTGSNVPPYRARRRFALITVTTLVRPFRFSQLLLTRQAWQRSHLLIHEHPDPLLMKLRRTACRPPKREPAKTPGVRVHRAHRSLRQRQTE